MMELPARFAAFIQEEQLFQPHDRLLIAVSGGVDSVVLCELCFLTGFDFVMAHCNFQLRGAESSRDEAFVRALGQRYKREVLVKEFDTALVAAREKLSIQAVARQLRYNWFRELLDSSGTGEAASGALRYILTAHHADDQVETQLMNVFKGTGIAGLRGILPKQDRLVRPLLFARKADLLEFAASHELSFVEDSSNSSEKYTRNFFRHQLIPAVSSVYPQAEENILANVTRFREAEMLYRQAVELHKKKLLERKGEEIHIPVLKWKKVVPLHSITYEIIREFGFSAHQTADVIRLMEAPTGSYVAAQLFRIIRNRNWMIIAPVAAPEPGLVVVEEGDTAVRFPGGMLTLKKHPSGEGWSTDPLVAEFNAGLIRFPLLLRKLKQGDYFYPLGMKKKKKAGRFLSDLKVSLPERENTWVLEMDRRIIWIVGRRIDDRFRITPTTTQVLQLTLQRS